MIAFINTRQILLLLSFFLIILTLKILLELYILTGLIYTSILTQMGCTFILAICLEWSKAIGGVDKKHRKTICDNVYFVPFFRYISK